MHEDAVFGVCVGGARVYVGAPHTRGAVAREAQKRASEEGAAIQEAQHSSTLAHASLSSYTRAYFETPTMPASLPPVDWKGLFEWSMKYNDGTRPGSGIDPSAQPMSEDDRKW